MLLVAVQVIPPAAMALAIPSSPDGGGETEPFVHFKEPAPPSPTDVLDIDAAAETAYEYARAKEPALPSATITEGEKFTQEQAPPQQQQQQAQLAHCPVDSKLLPIRSPHPASATGKYLKILRGQRNLKN